jgi:hypothetical protein
MPTLQLAHCHGCAGLFIYVDYFWGKRWRTRFVIIEVDPVFAGGEFCGYEVCEVSSLAGIYERAE